MKWSVAFMVFALVGSLPVTPIEPPPPEVGIEEKLGEVVPLDLEFKNETGETVRLGDLITKPTLLSLVYFHCPTVCKPLLSAKVDVINRLDMKPGREFNLLTISFNHNETPVHARDSKRHFMQNFAEPIPEKAWHFLTADRETILRLTHAVGYYFKPRGTMDFDHPVALILLSPEGKISRYLYGMSYLPFDLKMGLVEAADGKIGPTINRVLLYCFSYDPEGKSYAFNILKVTGTATLVFLALFLMWLIISTRRKRKKAAEEAE